MAIASPDPRAVTLVVRRTIPATAERLFAAWTEPDQLRAWWGPPGTVCPTAEVDLRVGGSYRIANQMPDGSMLWIVGQFEVIEPPHRLVYSWKLDPGSANLERVSVRFEPRDGATEVIVTHERIANPTSREQHEAGWIGCFEGLERYLEADRI